MYVCIHTCVRMLVSCVKADRFNKCIRKNAFVAWMHTCRHAWMHTCRHACILTCVYTSCLHAYLQLRIHARTHLGTLMYLSCEKHRFVFICIHAYIISIYIYMYIYLYTCIHPYVHTCILAYIHTQTYINAHTCLHTAIKLQPRTILFCTVQLHTYTHTRHHIYIVSSPTHMHTCA
jgi:hypothetical protein